MSNKYNDLSASEIYAIELSSNEPHYYAQIPGIIYHLTYTEIEENKNSENCGMMVRKKLSIYGMQLSCYLRQIAGKNMNPIWMSPEKIAEMTGMSVRSFYNAKNELMNSFEQLAGKSLIEVIKCKKSTTRQDGQKGFKTYDKIKMIHIWPEANAYMATLSSHENLPLGPVNKSVHNSSANAPYATAESANAPYATASPGANAPYATASLGVSLGANNKPFNKEAICKVTRSTSAHGSASGCCHFSSKDSVIGRGQELIDRAAMLMGDLGADKNFINESLRHNSALRVIDACIYTLNQYKARKIKGEVLGYLRRAIQKGWKWKDR